MLNETENTYADEAKQQIQEQRQAKIFHTIARITGTWVMFSSVFPILFGLGSLSYISFSGSFLSALPPLALIISGIVLLHLSIDLSISAERAYLLAGQGVGEDDDWDDGANNRFPTKYIISQSSYPGICGFLIRQVKE